ncbi:MAG: ATP-binding protein, partial [Candidatus Omnitrophica bacterium]|nr:ATP-binding protein [Candidatus Omnitrophota bacterium]
IVVEVEDSGQGISEENLKKVFEPFFTTKEPGKGTGLGLSVTSNIIKLHRGIIEITSQLAKGTKISLWFKVAKSE